MPELVADVAIKYPRPVAVGERFFVSDKKAKLLRAHGKAHDVPPEVDREEYQAARAEIIEPKKKRRYRRRDMRAED